MSTARTSAAEILNAQIVFSGMGVTHFLIPAAALEEVLARVRLP